MIRFIIGLILVYGSVGTLEFDDTANVAVQVIIAIIGLALMHFGVKGTNNNSKLY